jgi:RNA polymerase sigma-70 factor (ECF subfamily)
MNVHELPIAIGGGRCLPHGRRQAVAHSPRDVLEGMWSEVSPDLARLTRAMGVAADRADDVLQEVFVAAWQKAPADIDRQELKWWLIRVTTNRCNLEHRRRKRWRVVLEKMSWLRSATIGSGGGRTHSEGADAMAAAEERELVRRAVERLPPEQRSVLVLRYFEHYDARRIGEILEMPNATVRSHLHRARRALARTLTEAGIESDEI